MDGVRSVAVRQRLLELVSVRVVSGAVQGLVMHIRATQIAPRGQVQQRQRQRMTGLFVVS